MTCPPPYRPLRGAEPPHFVDRPEGENIGAKGIMAGSIAAFAAARVTPVFTSSLLLALPWARRPSCGQLAGKPAAAGLGGDVPPLPAKERALGALAAEIESPC